MSNIQNFDTIVETASINERALAELISLLYPYKVKILKIFLSAAAKCGLMAEDCMSIMDAAIWHASQDYDASKGASFKTYAYNCMRNELGHAIEAAGGPVSTSTSMKRRLAKLLQASDVADLAEEDAVFVANCSSVSIEALEEECPGLAGSVSSVEDSVIEGTTSSLSVDMQAALAELSDKERGVIILRYIKGYTCEEAARITNLTAREVDTISRRGIRALRVSRSLSA